MSLTLANDGTELAYEVSGRVDCPALIFIHSLGVDRRLWAAQTAAMQDRYRILRVDLRGHGRSGVSIGAYSIEQLAGDVLAVMDHARIERAHLCGISIGGGIAQWLAAEAPQRVDRLILANTAAVFGTAAAWRQRAETALRDGMQALLMPTLERWFTASWRERSPDTCREFGDLFLHTSPQAYAGCCEALAVADLRPSLGKISAPTLVLAGHHDEATTPAAGQIIADAVAGAELAVLDAAHLSPIEQPEAFNAALHTFIG
jgi:3-oxoadipate enol-lactonase